MNLAEAAAMPRPPTLALCIPTYKRADCLAVLLESAAEQTPGFDEVIVSDDASGDNTGDVVRGFRKRFSNLTYRACVDNVGLDENFRIAVSLCGSDYVWFMGDDDRLRPGAVAAVHALIRDYPGAVGMTVGAIDYDSRLEAPTGLRRRPDTRLVTGAADLFVNYADLLGFMSTTILKREAWITASVPNQEKFDNLYSQVYRIGIIAGNLGAWLVTGDLLVDYRSDNDQFKSLLGGELPRLKRDVDAYSSIIDGLFPDDAVTRACADLRILRTHIISRVTNGVAKDRSFARMAAFRLLLARYARQSFFWSSVAPMLFTPGVVLGLVRRLYHALAPSSGAARARQLRS